MNHATNIENDTTALALKNGRRVGQPGHDVAREYLLGRLTEIGLPPFKGESFELPFRRPESPHEFVNLAGIIPGKDRTRKPLLIGAHYDSAIDGPSADDNASSVAVVLACAESLAKEQPCQDVIIAIFDSEEPPYFCTEAMGSTRFYEDQCSDIEFECVIIMDLIGHDVEIPGNPVGDVKNMLAILGAESKPELLPAVVTKAIGKATGLRIIPTLNMYIGDMSDHHAFRLGGEPFLFLSCGQGRHYHTPQDDLDWVNFEKVQSVYEFVMELVKAFCDGGDDGIDNGHGSTSPDPTVDFEIAMAKDQIGDVLDLLGLQLKTRKDLDELAGILVAGLG